MQLLSLFLTCVLSLTAPWSWSDDAARYDLIAEPRRSIVPLLHCKVEPLAQDRNGGLQASLGCIFQNPVELDFYVPLLCTHDVVQALGFPPFLVAQCDQAIAS
jgi:hypothetical protein